MLWRRRNPTAGSCEEFLQICRYVGPGLKYEDGYDYISHLEDTWDKGSLYRMHTIRQQAAIELQHSAEDDAYITEQQIDKYLIANHEPEEGEEERVLAARQNACGSCASYCSCYLLECSGIRRCLRPLHRCHGYWTLHCPSHV